ncbi:hypothetical protein GRS48_05655 [Halorubrum sp. JWXQ-INN 858]|uniref:hypothetical protein n=1 Tax=Halorubrum sp. JWXQ-INN 858 TaxID=2690782 RepID=UPI0013579138|nr:hypothetical protein [Halorubrum sp. JWXQ-INN 858]MWV64311.1 hypothetical protein [Halorubrum sp. JWXQ-INN 858]
MNAHDAAATEEPPDRRFDGPWLRVLAAALVGWAALYALDRFLLEAATPAGAIVGFGHAYVLAPLVAAAVLLDALSLREQGLVDLGVFTWLYALIALVAPPIAVVHYTHREWLKPGDPDLLEGP